MEIFVKILLSLMILSFFIGVSLFIFVDKNAIFCAMATVPLALVIVGIVIGLICYIWRELEI